MTALDRDAFVQVMLALGETFNEPISEIRIVAYFDALNDLPLDQVVDGARSVMRTARFFPRPVDVREAVLGNPEERADVLWGHVIQQVHRVGYMGVQRIEHTDTGIRVTHHPPTFEDPLVIDTIERLWGSWRQMCETLPAGGGELVGWIKQFKQVYVVLATRQRREAPMREAVRQIAGGAVLRVVDTIAKSKVMPSGESIQTDLHERPMWAGAHLGGAVPEDDNEEGNS
jgi:hypothetical protein